MDKNWRQRERSRFWGGGKRLFIWKCRDVTKELIIVLWRGALTHDLHLIFAGFRRQRRRPTTVYGGVASSFCRSDYYFSPRQKSLRDQLFADVIKSVNGHQTTLLVGRWPGSCWYLCRRRQPLFIRRRGCRNVKIQTVGPLANEFYYNFRALSNPPPLQIHQVA